MLHNTGLIYLSLRGNQLTAAVGNKIAAVLVCNSTLEELSLEDNLKFNDAGLLPVCDALLRNSSLSKLVLQGTGLTDFGCELMAMMLKGNTTLASLYLGRNEAITPTGVDCLVEAAVWREEGVAGTKLTSLSVPIHPTDKIPPQLRGILSVDE
jgi:hypothetical protein